VVLSAINQQDRDGTRPAAADVRERVIGISGNGPVRQW
jgi:hypothetical protein